MLGDYESGNTQDGANSQLPAFTSQVNTYNVFNRLTKTQMPGTTATYQYKAGNMRMNKTVNGEKTSHVWDGSNIVADLTGTGEIVDIYTRGGGLISSAQHGYYLLNGHGDVVQITDSTGIVTRDYAYDAFGVERGIDEEDINPWRYCAEYTDLETDSIYLRHRYYNPAMGRFLNEDPIRDGLNWYTYCLNSPILFSDPFGLSVKSINDAYINYTKGVAPSSYDELEAIVGDFIFITDPVLLESFSREQLSDYLDIMKTSKGFTPTYIGSVALTYDQRKALTFSYGASRSMVTVEEQWAQGMIYTLGTLQNNVENAVKVVNDIKTIPNPFKLGVGGAISSSVNKITSASIKNLPQNVQDAFNKYSSNGWKGNVPGQTAGTKAGGTYQNSNNALPTTNSYGGQIKYNEFDVNNKLPNMGRDTERFISGSDGSIYFTNDHYNTFFQLK